MLLACSSTHNQRPPDTIYFAGWRDDSKQNEESARFRGTALLHTGGCPTTSGKAVLGACSGSRLFIPNTTGPLYVRSTCFLAQNSQLSHIQGFHSTSPVDVSRPRRRVPPYRNRRTCRVLALRHPRCTTHTTAAPLPPPSTTGAESGVLSSSTATSNLQRLKVTPAPNHRPYLTVTSTLFPRGPRPCPASPTPPTPQKEPPPSTHPVLQQRVSEKTVPRPNSRDAATGSACQRR